MSRKNVRNLNIKSNSNLGFDLNLKLGLRILFVSLMLQAIASCKADTFDMYRETINEDLRDPKTRVMQGGENDVNDLRNCEMLVELGRWRAMEGKFWSGTWNRNATWIRGSMISEGSFYLDSGKENNSSEIAKLNEKEIFTDKGKFSDYTKKYLIYIGPWKLVTFNYSTGFFGKTQTEVKKIRAFAHQDISKQILGDRLVESDRTYLEYEEATPENELIPEKPFTLPSPIKIIPDRSELCTVKWIAKYGYNAIMDQKTGKIIEAKE